MKRIFYGFTLLNLLVSLAILCILAASAIPSLQALLNNNKATNIYNQLFTLVQFTRIQAVNYHSQVILCPTNNQLDCINDWKHDLMIFVDNDNDKIRSEDEQLLRVETLIENPGHDNNETIKWHASGSLRYLRFKADGSTANQNGRLTYCLIKSGNVYAKQLIIYRTGRARKASQEEALEKCT